jgi:hypothetical protein
VIGRPPWVDRSSWKPQITTNIDAAQHPMEQALANDDLENTLP